MRSDDLQEKLAARYHKRGPGAEGLLCRECHVRRPWDKLHSNYEVIGGSIYRTWFCDKCGNMLRQDDLSYLMLLVEESGPLRKRVFDFWQRVRYDLIVIANRLRSLSTTTEEQRKGEC